MACTGSHHGWGGLALQKILVDVLGVPLQPGCVQQDIFTALLHSAFCRRSGVALKEGLYKKHTTGREGANSQTQGYIFKSPNSLVCTETNRASLCSALLPPTSQTEKSAERSLSLQGGNPRYRWEQHNASIPLLEESHGSISAKQPKRCLLSVLTSLPGSASGT